jgi:rubrerythrin
MAKKKAVDDAQVAELLYQALETELGGVQIYRKALECVVDEELASELERYLAETETHVTKLEGVLDEFGLDRDADTPGRRVVRFIGESLVKAMDLALESGKPEEAQMVATECVVHAETKDHLNWELIGLLLEKGKLAKPDKLQEAFDEIEDQEDEHLYHSMGWCRELHVAALGLPAALPPPEEEKHVKTAIGAARAKAQRDQLTS